MSGLLLGLFLALPAAPDYRTELGQRLAAELDRQKDPREAANLGERLLDRIGELPEVCYATGLAWNQAGEREKALERYDCAIAARPEDAVARYDRGELRLLLGDLPGAREDLEKAATLRPDHWAVHLRLAQVAARSGDATTFERALEESLRRGLDLRTLGLDAEWRGWLADPDLGHVVRRLVTVYGPEGLLEELLRKDQ